MKKSSLTLFCTASAAAMIAATSCAAVITAPKNLVSYADYYLREFEKEVARQRGGEKMIWRSKRDALTRVQQLVIDYPDDPEVQKLNKRARTVLMKSLGQFSEVDPSWTLYKKNEETLRKIIFTEGKKVWDKTLEEHKGEILTDIFPAPDPNSVSLDDLEGKYVLLPDVRYPSRQFYGATGEYIWEGRPSEGYYFINISGRQWLGPYEAAKRYRRTVDSSLEDVQSWTMLGKITDVTAEIPQAGENKVGNIQYGWVVTPVMLMVPDHVVSLYDAEAPSSGRFVGEDKVDQIKEGWFTVTSIPDDVTPVRLMEIFMAAIKEKNYKLYLECINPDRQQGDMGGALVRRAWDYHQERFAKQYVHATFDKVKITTIKGFDSEDELNQFFLSDDQKTFMEKAKGQKVYRATLESRAINENGQQLGTPHPQVLTKKGNGRWYVEEYMRRF